jgi:hypothetical protein
MAGQGCPRGLLSRSDVTDFRVNMPFPDCRLSVRAALLPLGHDARHSHQQPLWSAISMTLRTLATGVSVNLGSRDLSTRKIGGVDPADSKRASQNQTLPQYEVVVSICLQHSVWRHPET